MASQCLAPLGMAPLGMTPLGMATPGMVQTAAQGTKTWCAWSAWATSG
jgi:hypothetical protein